MTTDHYFDPRDLRIRLLGKKGQLALDAGYALDTAYCLALSIIEHYEGLEPERPDGRRPTLTDCVRQARAMIRQIEGKEGPNV